MEQDMLFVPNTVPTQHCCALNGKMKVKWVANKSMVNDLVWVKKQNFPNDTMSFFCYQNPKYISSGGTTMKTLEVGEKIQGDIPKLKKV
jgi:hypothetical protein